MSRDKWGAGESLEALQRKVADYERWFKQLDAQMRLLERERQKLSAVVTHTDAGFVVFDPSMKVVWSNDVFGERFRDGAIPSSLSGQECNAVLCRQARECEACPVRRTFTSGGVSHHEIALTIDGQERYIYATAMPIKAPEGSVEQTIVMLQDVSDLQILRRSAEALRASEALFRSIFEKTTAGMATVSLEGRFLQVNPAMCRFLGYAEPELLARSVQDVTYHDDLEETKAVFAGAAHERPRHMDLEKRYLRKDGRVVWGRTTAALIFDSAGRAEYSVALVQDITERKSLEQDLRQAEKMSAVGHLIAGVAHELNNPLAGVLGYSQLLLEMPVDERVRRGLDAISREADRCKKIVRNLQTFARKHKPEVEPVSVNDVIMSTLELRSYQLKVDDIEVVTDLDEELPVTLADAHQLRQVLLNVIINAHQAMAERGDGGRLVLRSRCHDGEIRVEVQDNGPGIDAGNMGKIFDPFFTTKEIGRGTGLGLSICYGIIREHGGRISAANVPGGGALFLISLPVRAPAAPGPRQELPRSPAAAAPPSRILVVDDEESIVDVLAEVLSMAGHRVDVARNGVEALEMMGGVSFDLVISDLKMPGMGGQELFDRVRERYPEMAGRMIFSTGDTVSRQTNEFLKRAGARCLQKPFEISEIKRVVEEILSAPVS